VTQTKQPEDNRKLLPLRKRSDDYKYIARRRRVLTAKKTWGAKKHRGFFASLIPQ
jgi:hypothetical protein